MNNLFDILLESAGRFPDRPALIFQEQTIDYNTLLEACRRLSRGLTRLGITRGDRIGLMLPNIPHFVFSYFALTQIGAVVVPLSIFHKSEEIRHQLEDSEARGVIYWKGFRDNVRQSVQQLGHCIYHIVLSDTSSGDEVRLNYLMEAHGPLDETEAVHPADTALIVYTAGSTGRPQGAELTHANLIFEAEALSQFFSISEEVKALAPIPFYHPLGHTLSLSTFLRAGASIILMPRFDAEEIFRMIERHKPDFLIAVPSMLREMLAWDAEGERDISSLRCVLVSGEAVSTQTLQAFENNYKVPVLEGYGLTEASPIVSFNDLRHERLPGSLGLPLPGVDMRIVDDEGSEISPGEVGEVIVSGPNVMKGYLNRPEATKDTLTDGWLHTGDLAELRDNGFGFIVVRKKNVIIKSGFNVYPKEVEKYLMEHPKIADAVIVGLPDPAVGEDIHAGIVLKDGEQAEVEEIITYSRERMAPYKCPRTVTFLKEIPQGPNGRVQRNSVKEMLLEKIKNAT